MEIDSLVLLPLQNASVALSAVGATFGLAEFMSMSDMSARAPQSPADRLVRESDTRFRVEFLAPPTGYLWIVFSVALSEGEAATLTLSIEQLGLTRSRTRSMEGVTTPHAIVLASIPLNVPGDVSWLVEPRAERPTTLPSSPTLMYWAGKSFVREAVEWVRSTQAPSAPPPPAAATPAPIEIDLHPPAPKRKARARGGIVRRVLELLSPPPSELRMGVTAFPLAEEEPHDTGAAEAQAAPAAGDVVRVWFGTNRRVDHDRKGRLRFRNKRDEAVHYGWCDVDVPASHRIGSLGSGPIARFLSGEDDRLKVVDLATMAEQAYWQGLRDAVAKRAAGTRHPTVFIHGYNVSFMNAALRAAQIGFDLQVPGPMCFFSWPSKGWLLGYAADAAAIEASEGAIADYLARLATDTGAERVDVIAHSMGNRGLLRAVQRILARADERAGRMFGHFILAAPDVDRTVFTELAAMYSRVANHTTLYISDRDKALWLSRLLYMYGRAGFAPPVTVVDDIDTVHVANVDLTLLGHGYVAEARDVLSDIHSVLTFDAAPAKRMGLRKATAPGGRSYWVISR